MSFVISISYKWRILALLVRYCKGEVSIPLVFSPLPLKVAEVNEPLGK
jgi:hypothetical protein